MRADWMLTKRRRDFLRENSMETRKLFDYEGNPILYDMKDEFSNLLKFNENDSNLDKWEKYKSYKVDENSVYGIDCDVCKLAVFIYNKTFEFLKKCKRPTKQYKRISTKDLLNCCIVKKVEGSLAEIIPFTNVFETDICYTREYKYQLIVYTPHGKEYYRGDVMTSFANTYNHYIKKFSDNKHIEEEIEKLAKNYHTIGNMIPVPTGFNMGRAGEMAKYDFWDLTMLKIWEWYQHKDDCKGCDNCDDALKELLFKDNNSVKHCKQWLDKFKKWHDFVCKNYLSDYIDDEKKPIVFWKGHSFSNYNLPNNEEDFYSYLIKLNDCIEKRNTKILNAIKTKRSNKKVK